MLSIGCIYKLCGNTSVRSLFDFLDVLDYFGFKLIVQLTDRQIFIFVNLQCGYLLLQLTVVFFFADQILFRVDKCISELIFSALDLYYLIFQFLNFSESVIEFDSLFFIMIDFEVVF